MPSTADTKPHSTRLLLGRMAETCSLSLLLAWGCGDAMDPMTETDPDGSSSTTTVGASEASAGALDDTTDPSTAGSTTSMDGATDDGTTSPEECEVADVGAVVPVGDGCCGCLCGETGWSCSQDTCLRPDGTAPLAPEAGFFELEPYEYAHGAPRTSPRSRVWYSFWPAATEPESRPLMILFNGGPGAATGLLFGSNTAPFTLDPQRTALVAATDAPWTDFANLLYVDAPSTGFSYNLPLPDGTQVPVGIDADQDASAFVSVLLRFLARHPDIQHNPVIIVGESYGGTRGSLMLDQLLDYEGLVDEERLYHNPSVHAEIVRHLAGLHPESCGRGLTRAQVAAQFGHFVVIQGMIAGIEQLVTPWTPGPACIAGGDAYHCDRPDGWLFDVIAEVAARLRQPDVLETALGVDPTTIAWMHADARVGAYGRPLLADESAMSSVFGDLGPGDAYYVDFNEDVGLPQPDTHDYYRGDIADVFLRAAATTETLMTDARLDAVIKTHTLAPVLEARAEAVVSAVHDEAPRPGVDRPGWLHIEYVPGWAPDGVLARELRMPRYDEAGHTVPLDDPELLLADVTSWWEGTRR